MAKDYTETERGREVIAAIADLATLEVSDVVRPDLVSGSFENARVFFQTIKDRFGNVDSEWYSYVPEDLKNLLEVAAVETSNMVQDVRRHDPGMPQAGATRDRIIEALSDLAKRDSDVVERVMLYQGFGKQGDDSELRGKLNAAAKDFENALQRGRKSEKELVLCAAARA